MRFPVQVNPSSIKVMAPRKFEDQQQIADQLLNGCVIILDFKYIDNNLKQRMISFMEGTLFGIDGKLVVLREDLVLLVPHGALDEVAQEPVKQPQLRQVVGMKTNQDTLF